METSWFHSAVVLMKKLGRGLKYFPIKVRRENAHSQTHTFLKKEFSSFLLFFASRWKMLHSPPTPANNCGGLTTAATHTFSPYPAVGFVPNLRASSLFSAGRKSGDFRTSSGRLLNHVQLSTARWRSLYGKQTPPTKEECKTGYMRAVRKCYIFFCLIIIFLSIRHFSKDSVGQTPAVLIFKCAFQKEKEKSRVTVTLKGLKLGKRPYSNRTL